MGDAQSFNPQTTQETLPVPVLFPCSVSTQKNQSTKSTKSTTKKKRRNFKVSVQGWSSGIVSPRCTNVAPSHWPAFTTVAHGMAWRFRIDIDWLQHYIKIRHCYALKYCIEKSAAIESSWHAKRMTGLTPKQLLIGQSDQIGSLGSIDKYRCRWTITRRHSVYYCGVWWSPINWTGLAACQSLSAWLEPPKLNSDIESAGAKWKPKETGPNLDLKSLEKSLEINRNPCTVLEISRSSKVLP